jgi:hypothetical protein
MTTIGMKRMTMTDPETKKRKRKRKIKVYMNEEKRKHSDSEDVSITESKDHSNCGGKCRDRDIRPTQNRPIRGDSGRGEYRGKSFSKIRIVSFKISSLFQSNDYH